MGVRGVYSRRSSWIFAVLFAGSLAFAAEEGKRAPDLPAGWLDQVERQIRASEYHFSLREDGAWSAPNRAHGLRVKVASTGIVLTSRAREGDEGDGGWTLGLALARWGRSGAMHPVEEARCSAQDNRTELARDTLTEWYVNSDAGLKQGFTIDSAPEAGPRRGPLVLEMEFTSDLGVFPSEDGQAVIFKTGQGEPVLRYAGLQVTDSTGAEVPARIAFVAGRLQIRIDDDDAVYPLEVDPLMTSPAWTAESNQVSANFGRSVATAGDVNGDGYSDVVVGAWLYDNVENDEGRAFLYLGSAAGLAASPAWTAESNQEFAFFGISVATAGDVNGDGYSDVVVGAYGYDNGESNEGRAFLYLGNDGPGLSLKPQQRRVSDAAPIDHLGVSDDTDGFRLALTGRSPYGRTRVKLEWEVKPLGVPLDGTALERSASWIDSGTAGAALDELASGLLAGAPQHWRVRLLYEPAGTPYQQHSRWLDPPWAGWNEAMLRTPPGEPGGSVPASGGTPLLVARATGGQITLSWGASCAPSDTDYEIYEGTLGSFYSHSALYCSTGGATTKTFTPAAGATYYLVVPRNGPLEGSYGLRTGDIERPAGLNACLAQLVAPCP